MAKKSKVNVAKLVRDTSKLNPDMKPSELTAKINSENGLNVNSNYVSNILSSERKKKPKRGRKKKSVEAIAEPTASYSSLVKAKNFVKDLGGVENAKAAVNFIGKLIDNQ